MHRVHLAQQAGDRGIALDMVGMGQGFGIRDAGLAMASLDIGMRLVDPVSYTHLDVYKRQAVDSSTSAAFC